MNTHQLAKHIQYTNVNPEMTRVQLVKHCEDCITHGFDAAMVAPCWATEAQAILRGSEVHVATAVSFPSGNDTTAMKLALVSEVLKLGVRDFDFTSNAGFLLSGMEKEFAADMRAVADLARAEGAQTKVILEFGLFHDPTLRHRAAELAVEAGIDFLKQSSGFSKGIPATPEDVAFLKRVAVGRARVKASGSINSRAKAEALIEAGASLLGTSSAVAIVSSGIGAPGAY
jgi:deoxyribose-phosphate aldolase